MKWVFENDRRSTILGHYFRAPGGLLIASVTKKARNISQIVRHTGSIGRWPHANPSTV